MREREEKEKSYCSGGSKRFNDERPCLYFTLINQHITVTKKQYVFAYAIARNGSTNAETFIVDLWCSAYMDNNRRYFFKNFEEAESEIMDESAEKRKQMRSVLMLRKKK